MYAIRSYYADYQWRHEPILYGWKPGAAHRWYGGRKQTTVFSLGDDVVSDNGDGTITLRFGETTSVISGTDIEIIEVETSIVITSYSIHYTKLYESGAGGVAVSGGSDSRPAGFDPGGTAAAARSRAPTVARNNFV